MVTEAAEASGAQCERGMQGSRDSANAGGFHLNMRPYKILIVEDDYLIALDAESALRQAGFEIAGIAANSAAAVEMAHERAPDLVVMDIRLAGTTDGVDTAIKLARSQIRCIFATSHSDTATRQRASAASPLGWVAKPYRPEDLVRTVRNALQSRD
jgi:DNA-binding NarL/FixJ family response regulator